VTNAASRQLLDLRVLRRGEIAVLLQHFGVNTCFGQVDQHTGLSCDQLPNGTATSRRCKRTGATSKQIESPVEPQALRLRAGFTGWCIDMAPKDRAAGTRQELLGYTTPPRDLFVQIKGLKTEPLANCL